MIDRGELRGGGRTLAGAVCGIGTGVSALLLYTNGLFVAGLAHDFGLTRTIFGLGVLIVTIALAVANPVIGWAIDRFGSRPLAAGGLVALALGFAALATLTRSVASYLLIQALLALFAASSGPIAYTKLVSGWFHRSRGVALGITLTGIGLAAALVPPVVARVIAADGWRAGYWTLAGIALLGLVPVWLLLRDPPIAEHQQVVLDRDRSSPFRSRAFWMMLAAFSLMALAFGGFLPHFVPLLTDAGVTQVQAGSLAALIGIAVIGSRIMIGLLVDRFFAPFVAIGLCLTAAAGCAVLLLVGVSGAFVAALAFGCAMGGEVDLISFLVSRYFRANPFWVDLRAAICRLHPGVGIWAAVGGRNAGCDQQLHRAARDVHCRAAGDMRCVAAAAPLQ